MYWGSILTRALSKSAGPYHPMTQALSERGLNVAGLVFPSSPEAPEYNPLSRIARAAGEFMPAILERAG